MEKMNEKRLAVLKVVLECLKVAQEETNVKVFQESTQNKYMDLSCGNIRQLEAGKFIETTGNKIIALTYVIHHLKRPFESISLPEEIEELKKQNIEMALEKILLILNESHYSASDFAESTSVLKMLRRGSFEGQ